MSTTFLFLILFVIVILLASQVSETVKIRRTLQSIADRSTGETVAAPKT